MELKIFCSSCGEEIEFNKRSYEEHIKKFHPKKINVKSMYFNASIWRGI